jgi:uncharacterized membrane protein
MQHSPDSASHRSFTEGLRHYWHDNWDSAVIVLLLTLVGLLLRVVNLTSIPTGLHGDEAIVGMEGQRVLREILIDPYSPSALGQPTAPFYLAGLTVWIWDNTVFAVRISAVIFGTLAIPALYVVVRRSLGVPTALLSTGFLMVMGWHIHYSRIAFPLPAWPLWIILTVAVMVQAVQSGSRAWWAAAGAMSGAGIYVYNAHTLALLILGLFALLMLIRQWLNDADLRAAVLNTAAFGLSALASLLPMLWFIFNNWGMYWNSIDRHSVRDTAEWQELSGPVAQIGYLAEQYVSFWIELSISPVIDYVDATGITPVVPIGLLVLSIGGMALALLRRPGPIVWLGVMIVILIPVATVLTEQGEMRRTLIIAPFLAMFGAIGIVELISMVRQRFSPVLTTSTIAVLGLVVIATTTVDLRNYYMVHGESSTQHWVFAESFYDASMYMQQLPGDHYVYFMANRWSIDYEPRRFLAPDVAGEDRSDEFGRFGLDVDESLGTPVFLLVDDYRPALEALEDTYPGGEVVTGSIDGRPTFIAYHLPNED